MTKLGTKRTPSKYCVKWKHDKSKCYDEYKEAIIGGKKYLVWYSRCSEILRIGNQTVRVANRIFKSNVVDK